MTGFPTHVGRCEFGSGCYHCDLDFYTVEKGGNRAISLCENCYEGEWTRDRRRVFEVVQPSKLFLVDCAESLIWGRELSGGAMLNQALGQGLQMVCQGLAWASSLSGDFDLRGCILGKCFLFRGGFDVACCHRLREEGGLVDQSEGSGGPCLV